MSLNIWAFLANFAAYLSVAFVETTKQTLTSNGGQRVISPTDIRLVELQTQNMYVPEASGAGDSTETQEMDWSHSPKASRQH